jgi:AraC-like DNA-binding protein
MFLSFVCFFTHFAYFVPLPAIFPFFDFLIQYSGSLVLPVYYIYFRILTVDEKFSFKAHGRFLIIPVILATTYCIGAFLTPQIEYRTWLFNENAFPDSPYIHFLSAMRLILRIQFLILVVITVIGNQQLIKKYGDRAEQYYSEINDGKYNHVKMLNYSVIILSGASFIAVAIGRSLLMPKDIIIYIVWTICSIMICYMGYMGSKQKPVNPTYETIEDQPVVMEKKLNGVQKKLLKNMLVLFDQKKIYLRSQLNIMDLVQLVGTNRTYISVLINDQFNQNFCSFVNSYRLQELERIICEKPHYKNGMLAERCGFGSINSLKRAVMSKTGMSLSEWKKQQLEKNKESL